MLEKIYNRYRKIISYGTIAILITILDIIVARLIFNIGVSLIIANTTGIITGSVVQYILTIKYTFDSKYNKKTFAIHVITFIIGLIISNIVINKSYSMLMILYSEKISFYLAKLLSIVSTFFITFILRNLLYSKY